MKLPRTGFITGSARWVDALQGALLDAGVAVSGCDDPDRIADACARFGPQTLGCYIQAPYEVTVQPGTDVERFGDLLTATLLARIRTAATIIPKLRADATIVLVADPGLADTGVPDDPHARFDLLRVLSQAMQADHPVRRVVVMGARCSVTDIAETAVQATITPKATRSKDAASIPDMCYRDWKDQLLSLTPEHDWERAVIAARGPVEYVGWVKPDGQRAVVVIRDSVVTPLRLEPHAPGWGQDGPSALPLARVLLGDVLRPHTAAGNGDEPHARPAETEADDAAEALAATFAEEVLGLLPASGFTLSGQAIRSWARAHLGLAPEREVVLDERRQPV